ncbi:MAG: 4Fe-4S binding protein [Gammaproteobacteria bacterium]|nr:4Fe-4S binding protein [Gammaproteobacteria bacterium]
MHNSIQQLGVIDIMPIDLVEFSSSGRLLIVGSQAQIDAVTPHLDGLQITSSIDKPDNITGWLGKFTVELKSQTLAFDLILDLMPEPAISIKVLPLGYFAPQDNQQKLAEALQQLPDLIGIFDKPRYFQYKKSICAHSRRQVKGCQHCIDACPAEAISSSGDTVTVNPSLCQGCGSCTAVCPSGAMTYALPTLDVSLDRLRVMLKAYFERETVPPTLLIHDENHGQMMIETMADSLSQTTIAFSIEEIGALGMPFWLSALAYGVGHIVVWDTGSHDDHDWLELQNEISKTNEMLTGIGFDQSISWFSGNNSEQLTQQVNQSDTLVIVELAQFAGVDDKRRMITIAMEHLYKQAPKPIELLPLNEGAAFGEIQIDKQACTLCMSCVSVCPVGAVLDGVDKPQLNFVEDLCVQCSMCSNACPENAISLNPRYLFDREQSRKVRLLYEEPIFHCISCNKPFATQKMITTMTEKLKGHAMFQGAALERLKMCEDCRVKAMFKEA